MEQLSTAVEGQQKNISDNSELLKDLSVGIESLGDNLKNMQKEMDYWRNPEVREAEENLESLLDKVPLENPVSSGPSAVSQPPEDQYSFLAQRPNIFPVPSLGNVPTSVVPMEEE